VCNAIDDMKQLLLLVLFFQTAFIFSQKNALILSSEQNDSWFETLESSSLEIQLKMIKERMLNDTSVFIVKTYPDRITIDRFPKLDSLSKIRVKGSCKPLYMISYKQKKQKSFHFENPLNTDQIKLIVDLIDINNISRITILRDIKAKAIFGTRGSCGVIMMDTNKRNLWKRLEKLKFSRDG
jgi:hypothetical protein